MLITVNRSSSFYQMAALPFSLTVILRSGRVGGSTGLDRCPQPRDLSSSCMSQRQLLSSQGF